MEGPQSFFDSLKFLLENQIEVPPKTGETSLQSTESDSQVYRAIKPDAAPYMVRKVVKYSGVVGLGFPAARRVPGSLFISFPLSFRRLWYDTGICR